MSDDPYADEWERYDDREFDMYNEERKRTYYVFRIFADDHSRHGNSEVIYNGLTLEEAKTRCRVLNNISYEYTYEFEEEV